MKAAVLFEVNKPLVIEDVSVPNPGPREVLIRTRVAGLAIPTCISWKGCTRIRCLRCSAMNQRAWSKKSAPTSPM
jgi:D-arabinose 1-dehydrogenase-like Zn-dependent alcohol dehydrogenase